MMKIRNFLSTHIKLIFIFVMLIRIIFQLSKNILENERLKIQLFQLNDFTNFGWKCNVISLLFKCEAFL